MPWSTAVGDRGTDMAMPILRWSTYTAIVPPDTRAEQ